MDRIKALKYIGLNDKEARCYLALLPLNQATAYMVALRSGIKKPTAYVVLESLVNKGFALKIPSQDKVKYIAKSPKECMAFASERMSAAQGALPELMAMRKDGNEERVSVAYFEGMDGIRELYEKMIKIMKQKPPEQRSLVLFAAHEKDTAKVLQEYWVVLNERFARNEITRKAITTKHESIKRYLQTENLKKYRLQLKAISEDSYSSNISIEVYDDFVQIISHRYMQGILIQNPDVAGVMKQIFNLVWSLTKEKSV